MAALLVREGFLAPTPDDPPRPIPKCTLVPLFSYPKVPSSIKLSEIWVQPIHINEVADPCLQRIIRSLHLHLHFTLNILRRILHRGVGC